jgi:hypothetical protein
VTSGRDVDGDVDDEADADAVMVVDDEGDIVFVFVGVFG